MKGLIRNIDKYGNVRYFTPRINGEQIRTHRSTGGGFDGWVASRFADGEMKASEVRYDYTRKEAVFMVSRRGNSELREWVAERYINA